MVIKPFLKWPGGKGRLASFIHAHAPLEGEAFFEPFLGSTAVSLASDFKRYVLTDTNPHLILTYQCLMTWQQDFIWQAQAFFRPETNKEQRYKFFRTAFNTHVLTDRERSALFIYLNRHCYNGLYRENKKGEFNAPFGTYAAPSCPVQQMEAFCEFFNSRKVDFKCRDFRETMTQARPGDYVYCDPPYHGTWGDYTAAQFTTDDHIELWDLALAARKRGAIVVISNSDTEFTRNLYQGSGVEVIKHQVRRTLSCKERNKASELLVILRP